MKPSSLGQNIYDAVAHGDVATFKELYAPAISECKNYQFGDYDLPLVAAFYGQKEIYDLLVKDFGTSSLTRTSEKHCGGRNALMVAARMGHEDFACHLIRTYGDAFPLDAQDLKRDDIYKLAKPPEVLNTILATKLQILCESRNVEEFKKVYAANNYADYNYGRYNLALIAAMSGEPEIYKEIIEHHPEQIASVYKSRSTGKEFTALDLSKIEIAKGGERQQDHENFTQWLCNYISLEAQEAFRNGDIERCEMLDKAIKGYDHNTLISIGWQDNINLGEEAGTPTSLPSLIGSQESTPRSTPVNVTSESVVTTSNNKLLPN